MTREPVYITVTSPDRQHHIAAATRFRDEWGIITGHGTTGKSLCGRHIAGMLPYVPIVVKDAPCAECVNEMFDRKRTAGLRELIHV